MATGEGDLAIVDALERLRLEQQETNNVLRQMLYPVQLISSCCVTTLQQLHELAATSTRLVAGLQECVSSLASIRRHAAAISALLAAHSAAVARDGIMAAHAAAARHGLLLSAACCLVAAAALGLPTQWRACALPASPRPSCAPVVAALRWSPSIPASRSGAWQIVSQLQLQLAPLLSWQAWPAAAAVAGRASGVALAAPAWAGPWLGWLGPGGVGQSSGARGLGSRVACRTQVAGGYLGAMLLLVAWLAAAALLLRPSDRPNPSTTSSRGTWAAPLVDVDDMAKADATGAGAVALRHTSNISAPPAAAQLQGGGASRSQLQPLPAACVADMWLQSAALVLLPLQLAAAACRLGASSTSSDGGGAAASGAGGWLLQLQLPVVAAALWLMRGASPLAAVLLAAVWHAGLPLAVLVRLRVPLQAWTWAWAPAAAPARALAPAPTLQLATAADAAPAAVLGTAMEGGRDSERSGDKLHSPGGLLPPRRHAVAVYADGFGADAHPAQHPHPQHSHQHGQSPPSPPVGWPRPASSHAAAPTCTPLPAAPPVPGAVCSGGSGAPGAGHGLRAGVPQPTGLAADARPHPTRGGLGGSASGRGWGWGWGWGCLQGENAKVLAAEAWLSLGPVLVGVAPVVPQSWWLGAVARAVAWAVLLAAAGLGAAAVLAAPEDDRREHPHLQHVPRAVGGSGMGSASPAGAGAGGAAGAGATAGAAAGAGRLGAGAGHGAHVPASPQAAPRPVRDVYTYPERPPASQAASPAALATAAAVAAARQAVAAAGSPLAQTPRCRRRPCGDGDGAWSPPPPVSAPCTPTRTPGWV